MKLSIERMFLSLILETFETLAVITVARYVQSFNIDSALFRPFLRWEILKLARRGLELCVLPLKLQMSPQV